MGHSSSLTAFVRGPLQIRHKINLPRFHEFLSKKRVVFHDWGVDTTGDDVVASWEDPSTTRWAGVVPRFTAHYSAHSAIMTHVTAFYNRNHGKKGVAFNAQELRERLMDELKTARVLAKDTDAPKLVMGPLVRLSLSLQWRCDAVGIALSVDALVVVHV